MTLSKLFAKKLYTGDEIIENCKVEIENNKIKKIKKLDKVNCEDIIAPGFIDIHNHGGYGIDYIDASIDDIKKLQINQASEGISSMLATIGLSKKENILKSLKNISSYIENENNFGTKILGIHMEGPFLSKEKSGVMDDELTLNPDVSLMEDFIKASRNNISLMTLAPELKGAKELVSFLIENNIIASAGHTNAKEEDMVEIEKYGLDQVTHLFNAMRGFHHRDIGIIGESLYNEKIFVEMVGFDTFSISPKVWNFTYKLKGPDKMIIATDALTLKGLKNGEYNYGGKKINFIDGFAYTDYYGQNRLPGKPMTFIECVKNVLKFTDAKFEDVVKMACVNPARRLGLRNIGKIKENYIADINVFDNNFNLKKTLINGK